MYFNDNFKYIDYNITAASQGFLFGGNTLRCRPRRGSGGGAPWITEPSGEISKIFKTFLKKIAKMHYFSIYFKKVNKPCVIFSRIWTKNTNCWEILRNFRKISKTIIRKLRKINYFLENLTNPALIFRASGLKTRIVEKF